MELANPDLAIWEGVPNAEIDHLQGLAEEQRHDVAYWDDMYHLFRRMHAGLWMHMADPVQRRRQIADFWANVARTRSAPLVVRPEAEVPVPAARPRRIRSCNRCDRRLEKADDRFCGLCGAEVGRWARCSGCRSRVGMEDWFCHHGCGEFVRDGQVEGFDFQEPIRR